MERKDPPNNSYTTYEYDSENHLTAVHDGGAPLFAALYDGNGERVFTVAPRQNTGNWHDDWNDGRWAVAEPQNGYNDAAWNYDGTVEPKPTELTTEPSTSPEPTEPSSGDDGSWWPGKYEGGDNGYDDGQWHPDVTPAEPPVTEPGKPRLW